MQVKDLSGKLYNWNITKYYTNGMVNENSSEPHARARRMLRNLFPLLDIYEEVVIPGENLRIDLYLPFIKLAIEIHGQQHYEFIPHFHGSQAGFVEHIKRDQRKLEWCELNNIKLAILKYNEDDNEWRARIAEVNN